MPLERSHTSESAVCIKLSVPSSAYSDCQGITRFQYSSIQYILQKDSRSEYRIHLLILLGHIHPNYAMLRGDLSNLRRRSAGSSSRAGSFRSSWSGSRGAWHQGKDRISKGFEDQTPVGRLISEFTLDDISRSAASTGEARITNCAYAASYSLSDEKPFRIIVPGVLPCRRERIVGLRS